MACWLLASLFLICRASAFDAGTVRWKVSGSEGNKVEISPKGGVLQVDYDVDVNGAQQVGHLSMKQAVAELQLAEPITLKGDQRHVVFEAAGIDAGANTRGEASAWLRPILRDTKGRRFYFYPNEYPHLNPGTPKWGTWMTQEFSVTEAGGAADPMYDVDGGGKDSVASGELTLVGFQIVVRAKEYGRKTGRMALGAVDFPGAKMPYRNPFGYVDNLLPAVKGRYSIGARMSSEFQGPALKELKQSFDYDPADPASGRQKLEFPLGGDDVYWISYCVLDAEGKPLTQKELQYEVVGNPNQTAFQPVDLTKPPVLGCLRINPVNHGNGVYESSEAPEVTVRVFGSAKRSLDLSWEVLPYDFDTALQTGTAAAQIGESGWQDLTLRLQWQPGRDAYRLRVTAKESGRAVDSQMYVFGRKTDLNTPYTNRTGAATDRNFFRKHSYNRLTYVGDRAFKHPTEDAAVAEFERELNEMAITTHNITYMVEATDLEVLPGVYHFALLDRLMDAAADRGCGVTFRIAVASGKLFPWQKYCRARNYDGLEVRLLHKDQLLPVPSDPRYIAIYERAFKAMHDRYGSHPGFQGYYIMAAMGDWPDAYVEIPQMGLVSGYDPATRVVFRDYLRDTLRLTLPQLNERWGSHYDNWEAVEPPLPEFASGSTPDLRKAWLDFCEFKTSWSQKWFQHMAGAIRQYDSNHVVICYTENPQGLFGTTDYLHNGGNHFLQGEGTLVDAWEKHQLGWITEPHHPYRWASYGDPAEKGWVLDWSLFIATMQAGGGGSNLHMYFDPRGNKNPVSLFGAGYALDRFTQFETLCNELQQITLIRQPREIGVLQDFATTYAKHRTVFLSRSKDLRRWFELLTYDGVPFEDVRDEHMGQYKLLLPNVIDEVLSEQNIERITRFAQQGGKVILSANAGKYSVEKNGTAFPLLRRLGITPPSGKYVTDELNVSAQVATANPLFGAGEKIGFFTVGQQAKDKKDGKLSGPVAFNAYPYRFIPETDYFGYYRDNKETNGEVLARFASGGVALSLHRVGQGEVAVFWGTPDMQSPALKGMMTRAAQWAGVQNPNAGSEIPFMLEADNTKLGRHYAMLYQKTPGSYRPKLPSVPSGEWFIDDMVSGERFGIFKSEELQKEGLALKFNDGSSPLKVLRMLPYKGNNEEPWVRKYHLPEQ